ncbi:MAG: hypothetical protein II648_06065, partial [Bacteroidales bacterium]|nr:hypothetical protein [Bacteroidales bacterium]
YSPSSTSFAAEHSIPLPQQTPCYWEDASSDWSMFLWDGELMSGRFTSNEGVVNLSTDEYPIVLIKQ